MPALSELKWEEPPPSKGRGAPTIWPGIVASLKEHPGQWAMVAIGKSDSCSIVRKHGGTAIEVVSRQHENNGLRATYARWVASPQ